MKNQLSNKPSTWKPIPGYNGLVAHPSGLVKCTTNGLKMAKPNKRGYVCYTINRKTTFRYKLIALAWVPNPENKPRIWHKNGNPSDDRADNLVWVYPKEIQYRHEGKAKGEDHGASKLTDSMVKRIRRAKKPIGVLAKSYGVSRQSIRNIRIRKTWKHLK